MLVKLTRDKHSSLLRKLVNFGPKKLYNIGPRPQLYSISLNFVTVISIILQQSLFDRRIEMSKHLKVLTTPTIAINSISETMAFKSTQKLTFEMPQNAMSNSSQIY